MSEGAEEERWELLRRELDKFCQEADLLSSRDHDPVGLVWAYPQDRDREVVALVAASLAYGRVSLLRGAIVEALAPLGPSPYQALLEYDLEWGLEALGGFVYRMTRGDDVAHLYQGIAVALRRHGSLKGLFLDQWSQEQEDLRPALTHFVRQLRRWSGSSRRGLHYLLPDPSGGGACKRLNLMLRWLVRGPDEVDLGLWPEIPASKLTIPLDTHIDRISRYLGLARRKTQDWKLAREITDQLKRLDPEDPLKYDFALCHLGIEGACPQRPVEEICARCSIQAVCGLRQGLVSGSQLPGS